MRRVGEGAGRHLHEHIIGGGGWWQTGQLRRHGGSRAKLLQGVNHVQRGPEGRLLLASPTVVRCLCHRGCLVAAPWPDCRPLSPSTCAHLLLEQQGPGEGGERDQGRDCWHSAPGAEEGVGACVVSCGVALWLRVCPCVPAAGFVKSLRPRDEWLRASRKSFFRPVMFRAVGESARCPPRSTTHSPPSRLAHVAMNVLAADLRVCILPAPARHPL